MMLARPNAVRHYLPVASRIYSVGYEGLEAKELVRHLVLSKVTLVIDVRLNPVSRKPGFSRKALSSKLAEAGIAYRHEPELGNPPENRDSFRRGDGQEGRRRMRARLENGSAEALSRLIADAHGSRIAVLCVERNGVRCHRQVITDKVSELDPSIQVVQIL